MKTYFALLLKDEDSAYGVVFPDVPGCFSAGDTFDEALANAAEALRLHVQALRELGGPVAEPRSFEDILVDPEVSGESRVAVLVPIKLVEADEPFYVSVALGPALREAVEVTASREGISQAAVLAEAAREKVAV